MPHLAFKSAAILGATLLSALAAGCGSSAKPSNTTNSGHQMAGMSMSAGAHAGATTSGMAMTGMIPLVSGANGTSPSAAGLTLKADVTTVATGRTATLTLNVQDAQGLAVTQFERDQTKLMHLIIVRSDLTGYQHIHPLLGSGGLFTVPLLLPAPGRYHAIADFTTAGKRYALAVAITAPGTAATIPLPVASPTANVDGYDVQFQHGALSSSAAAQLTFTIRRGGKAVTALQPYLGAFGHLVALRKPDLAYSHVHPVGHDTAAAAIAFDAEFPSPATYRLFLQFRAAGRVHTAPFTVTVSK